MVESGWLMAREGRRSRIFQKRATQAAEHLALLLGCGVKLLEQIFREKALMTSDEGLRNDLKHRTGGNFNEACKVFA
jgi:hypothetical protein